MKKVLFLTLSISLLALACNSIKDPSIMGWSRPVSLFDGKTFKGWVGDTNKTFRIEDSAIVGGTMKAKIPRNEFLCTTRTYTNFVLRLKFKLLGGPSANGGVQVRTRGEERQRGRQSEQDAKHHEPRREPPRSHGAGE